MTMRLHCYIAALFATVLAAPQIYAPSPARADIFPPPGMAPDAANAVLPTAKGNLHLSLNVDDYGAIGDGNSHPLSGYFATAALAAVKCPSLNFFVGTQHTGNTNTSTSLTGVGTLSPYVINGMTITDSLGDIPGSTTVTAVNYSTGAVTISQAATGTHTGDVFVMRMPGVNWATVEMDWCAIDAAIWAARNNMQANYTTNIAISFNQKIYYLSNSLNFTCLGGFGGNCGAGPGAVNVHVYGNNALFYCTAADPANNCIDAMGSQSITASDFELYAWNGTSCSGSTLKRGIQVGSAISNITSTLHRFSNIVVDGCFSQAPWYNEASEGTITDHDLFSNEDTSGVSYGGIWDMGNYWGVTSDYTNITVVPYTAASFGLSRDFGSWFTQGKQQTSGGLWIYGTTGIKFDNSYIFAGTGGQPCMTFYNDGTSFLSGPIFDDVNCEGASTSNFVIVSKTAAATPTLYNMRGRLAGTQATTNVFSLGTNTSSLTLPNLRLDIDALPHTPNFFDTPASYTVRGANIRLPTAFAGDNIATGWTGYKCVGLVCANGGISSGTNAVAGAIGEVMATGGGAANGSVTITIASPAVISDAGACASLTNVNGCVSPGSIVNFTTTGALPTGITVGTNYYVIATNFVAGTSYEISTVPFGTAVNTSGTQSGTQTRVNTAITTTGNPFNGAVLYLSAGDWDCGAVSIFTTTGVTTFIQSWLSASGTSAKRILRPGHDIGDAGQTEWLRADQPRHANLLLPRRQIDVLDRCRRLHRSNPMPSAKLMPQVVAGGQWREIARSL